VAAGHAASVVAPFCLLAAAVGTAVLFDGGFSPASRIAFAGLAAAALVAAWVRAPASMRSLRREPVVLVLAALGALGAASAAWTVGFAGAALRWGAVAGAYAAVLVATAALVRGRRWGAAAVAALICALATVSAAVGLVAVATHAGPYADRVSGAWRPGGTLEYSPALALLEVSALPALLSGMCRGPTALRSAAGLAGGVCAAALALSGSRTGLALAALVCALVVVAPRRTVRAPRVVVASALALLATAGLAAHLAAGGETAVGPRTTVAGPASTAAQREPDGGFWHGRLRTWRAAVETIDDRPLAGAGADAFLAASARHQREGPVRFAHDLPLELGVELGVPGALLALALYAAAAAALWRGRRTRAAWLCGPAAGAFLAASLLDWPWHLAGSGAVWAAALGAIVGAASAGAVSVPAPETTS
jgi:O-antigen ligase